MARLGLYKTAFSSPSNDGMMDEHRTNRHWKREEDNYLQQLGMLPLIKKDPNAFLGYHEMQDPEMLTLRIRPFPSGKNWGTYSWVPYQDPRSEGDLDIKPDLSTTNWGETLVHELGHAGSRFMQSDQDAAYNVMSGHEETRQRFMDYVLHPPTSVIHRDAERVLRQEFSPEEFDQQVEVYRSMLTGPVEEEEVAAVDPPPPKPKQKPLRIKKKPKKKTLMDVLK